MGVGSVGAVGPPKGFRKVRRAPLVGLPMVLGRRLRVSLSSLSVSSSIPLPSSSTLNSFRWSRLIRRASKKFDRDTDLRVRGPGGSSSSLSSSASLSFRRRGEG